MSSDLGRIYGITLNWETKKYEVGSAEIQHVSGKTIWVSPNNFTGHRQKFSVVNDRLAHTPASAVLIAIDDVEGEIQKCEERLAYLRGKRRFLGELLEEVRGSMEGLR